MNDSLTLHGGALDAMKQLFPCAPEPWLDLSTGVNPWPYDGGVSSLQSATLLPTAAAHTACRDAMAAAVGAPADSLLLAPGSELLIRLLPSVLSLNSVCVLSPSYADHEMAWQRSATNVVTHSDPLRLVNQVDGLVICNPNNPDGRTWTRQQLTRAREALAAKGGYLIVDEAYADLQPELSMAASGGESGLIIFRSFGKFYGLPGLRLGALIAPPSIVAGMSELLGVWPVTGPTLECATAAFRDAEWQRMTREHLRVMRCAMDTKLRDAGIIVKGGTDLYRYVDVTDAKTLWNALAERGIYTRRFSWSNTTLRIGLTSSEADLQRLCDALSSVAAST